MDMKYKQLKELLEKIEDIDDILQRFKINVENNMVKLVQDREIDERDYNIPYEDLEEEDREALYNKWSYISADCIFNLYNAMGWSTKKFAERTVQYSIDVNCAYVDYYLSDAWNEIRKLDDWHFFYAMIILVNGINDRDQNICKYIKYPIEEFLKEYELIDLIRENVFIAMSFDESMKDTREAIESVIKRCGYNPIIIDEKQHNNEIIPEIFFEIKRSKFIIADLTQHKPGVYYEAGYGKALNKEIILSCRSDDFSNVHFDLEQQNIIKWENKSELEVKLEKRIEATIGKRY